MKHVYLVSLGVMALVLGATAFSVAPALRSSISAGRIRSTVQPRFSTLQNQKVAFAGLRNGAYQQASKLRMAGDSGPSTLFDKIWKDHLVDDSDGSSLIYIDRHLVHEVTSPQAFEGLRTSQREVRRPENTLATVDHNVPTSDRSMFESVETFIKEVDSQTQVLALEDNVKEFGVAYFGMDDKRQGIVHIIGPEQGFTLPGSTVVCGDSHTATHGAFGALAFGIGTSEVEHVLATQTLLQKRAKNMKIEIKGDLLPGVTSKDVILHVIGVIGTAGGTGHVMEFCGPAIEKMSMEARMSICNMAIEAGARAGMIAPDQVTFDYLEGRPLAPKGEEWEKAKKYWQTLKSDEGAKYDTTVTIDAKDIAPTVTWGTSPQDVAPITGTVPDPAEEEDLQRRAAMERSLTYMGLKANEKLDQVKVDKVFIGSCTNARIEDMRVAAAVAKGRKVADHVYAMVVPGSGLVKEQAIREGLDKIFIEAGFDWREPGCSMCLAMNPDKLKPGERCASTSNRNFEGRQGGGGRTHLMSPQMAAAAAIQGTLTDIRTFAGGDVLDKTIEPDTDTLPKTEYSPVQRDPAPSKAAATEEAGAGGMPKFNNLKGIAAPLDLQNIDTDMIIPKQFLKTIKRTGLGVSLFYEMRFNQETGEELPEFVLNQEPYRNAKILVAGNNFGCGSSREHAPWAISDFGIRTVISTGFADIFFNNCFKNGMLPIKLDAPEVAALMEDAKEGKELEIDLPSQKIVRANGESIPFEVDAFRKKCLMEGLDDIGLTFLKADKIDAFEEVRDKDFSFMAGIPLLAK
mmetsp:Transcript_67405/g.140465  ORF Transcript_67405/g.140465 Transcript_67405/m.140465 type:complete len:797 (-) Transcript_67405:343-2733(-)|eukprot:CAMPEP_0181322590 /NCGR_PEP_ID=MMETSP1101-20121128/19310_1 /TAXON_ID=46948 /ORGANISM="Rhodomonas abbreviata, Strain Caron Lab Isolate" /LENGTH=796 /DNA_ID=CAMNT_0023430515 /DNA_START=62 /DNA_END=2452 /DNA_ORIENTATION=-